MQGQLPKILVILSKIQNYDLILEFSNQILVIISKYEF